MQIKYLKEPIAVRFQRQIEIYILEDKITPGAHLLTINELAYRFRISRDTVYRSVKELTKKGILYSRQGSGIYVSENAKEILQANRIADFDKLELMPALKMAKLLGMTRDDLNLRLNEVYGSDEDSKKPLDT